MAMRSSRSLRNVSGTSDTPGTRTQIGAYDRFQGQIARAQKPSSTVDFDP
jgi:hypothetical protein